MRIAVDAVVATVAIAVAIAIAVRDIAVTFPRISILGNPRADITSRIAPVAGMKSRLFSCTM